MRINTLFLRSHPGEGRDLCTSGSEIPAFAGMTAPYVVPAQAGIQGFVDETVM